MQNKITEISCLLDWLTMHDKFEVTAIKQTYVESFILIQENGHFLHIFCETTR